MMKNIFIICAFTIVAIFAQAQEIDYSVVSVDQESGLNFKAMTTDNDYVCMPIVERDRSGCQWYTNRIIGASPNGDQIAFLAEHNNTINIYIKDLSRVGSSRQRTIRNSVLDFSYSPDGKYICFAEKNESGNTIFQTNSSTGYACRQIVSGGENYTPVYSSDMSQILFARQEGSSISIWSSSLNDNSLSTYTSGMNPYPLSDGESLLCSRTNTDTEKNEIWRVNITTGAEECIISDASRSFTSPTISPDGNWILFVGSTAVPIPDSDEFYYNTDLFVCHSDGTMFTQLTYHVADDLSPVWSNDGSYIYFVSQRGSSDAKANVWRMDFNLQ